MKISVTIIAFNEADNIAAACQSVAWADEILVVDSQSTDRTREIAVACGAKVLVKPWTGFSQQKQFAAEQALNNWIFSLDADERVSDELRAEILRIKNSSPENFSGENVADGYRIPRRSFYMNRWIRGGGWYPDRQLRLYDRRHGAWKSVLVHESVAMLPTSKIGNLHGDILHYSIPNASYHQRLIGERYAPLAARQMFENGRRTTRLKIASAGLTAFVRTFFLKSGWRDGLAGFCIARFAAHHAFLKHLLLWEMQEREKAKAENGKPHN